MPNCCRCGDATKGTLVRANPVWCRFQGRHPNGGPVSAWNHLVCDACWYFWNPDREPVRLVKEVV